MKKIGISNIYSYSLRFFGGLLIAYTVTFLPPEMFSSSFIDDTFEKESFNTIGEVLINSLYNSILLSIKIIILISILIIIMDYIKNLNIVKNSAKNVSKGFSIVVGVFLGITYGAGILIKEANNLSKSDLFYIGTFLMICHAIIEDTLLFVIFGADFTMVIVIRVVWAIVLSYILLKIYEKSYLQK